MAAFAAAVRGGAGAAQCPAAKVGRVQSNGEVFHGRPSRRLLHSVASETCFILTGCAMRRREFVGLLGSAAAWPLAAWGQQGGIPVVGLISNSNANASAPFIAAFRKGLSETGNVEGQNVRVEYHWLEGQYD